MNRALASVMPSQPVENLQVYQKSVDAADAIFALTNQVSIAKYGELCNQLRTSSGRIQAHLQEGSGQGTDKAFARYVAIARGSAKETKGHLRRALGYGAISDAEYERHWEMFDEIAAMLSGLKNYLEAEGGRRP